MDTVALILKDGDPAVIVPYREAQEAYAALHSMTLQFEDDRALLQALTVALGVLPPPVLGRMPDGKTFAEFHLEKWRAAQE